VFRQLKLLAYTDGVNMLTSATYADVLRPCKKTYAGVYDVVLIIGGSLLIGFCAQVRFFLPANPVPVTGQTFAVLMVGALLGARRGCVCVLAYIMEGVVGLPVFATGAGSAVLRGLTGGYIVGFVPAAYIVGLLAEKGWDRRIGTTVMAMGLGNIVIYAFGLVWLCCLPSVNNVLLKGLYPFMVGDLVKIALAAILLPSGWKLLRHAGLADNIE
jgi:biotin transporter BioY